ncbi:MULTISPECIES: hypothetical protein [unclassified Streptomyces]|uniref:hypothetical protein n=1 Tax=unclassified Streptomyces TaxID=2593676 RepID=UPI000B0C2244|nr:MULTISPECIES: hypothetical protein [unclassified Streptomyces]
MASISRKATLAGALALGAGMLIVPQAQATTPGEEACPPDVWTKVVRIKSGYEHIGPTTGKKNGGGGTSRLTYAMTTTTAKETKWTSGLTGSASWGIAKVEASVSRDIVNKTEKGVTVTNWIEVPAGKYGYTTPKIERTDYVVERWQDTAGCGARFLGNEGSLAAITVYPFFSECIANSPCTPKP